MFRWRRFSPLRRAREAVKGSLRSPVDALLTGPAYLGLISKEVSLMPRQISPAFAYSSDALVKMPNGSELSTWARRLRGDDRRAVIDAALAVAQGSANYRLRNTAEAILHALEVSL